MIFVSLGYIWNGCHQGRVSGMLQNTCQAMYLAPMVSGSGKPITRFSKEVRRLSKVTDDSVEKVGLELASGARIECGWMLAGSSLK